MIEWKKQDEIIRDIQQTFLNPDLSISKNTYSFAKKSKSSFNYNYIALCPFCLSSNAIGDYSLRKGFRVCPICGSNMKLSTLTEIQDLKEFVDFVFNYRYSGFWSKICLDVPQTTPNIRFETWNRRLYELGISKEFWEIYRNLRGDSSSETTL